MSGLVERNTPDMHGALDAYLTSLRRQIAAMESLQRTSDQLLQTISCGDSASLGGILDVRATACVEVSRAFALPPIELDMAQLSRSDQPGVRATAAEISENRRRIESLKDRALAAQSECEEALQTALEDVKRQLRETAGRRQVKSAYQSQPLGPPRFLDRKK